MRKIPMAVAGIEEIWGSIESGKFKKMHYLLELPKGNPAAKSLMLACES